MSIGYKAHAVLNGTAPSNAAYTRGGKLGEGTLAKMVALGVEHIDKGYEGVMVLFDGGSLDAAKIKEVIARPDFPR